MTRTAFIETDPGLLRLARLRGLLLPDARRLGHPSLENTLPRCFRPAAKVRILHFKYLRSSDMASVVITTFEVFTRVGPDNSLERLTERSVGLITDRPSNVNELFVMLLQ